jgi:predicted RNA-binding protein with PIN domain
MKRPPKKLVVVDGYNVLNAWRRDIDALPLSDLRDQLAERLINYAGYSGQEVILVFDAWMSGRMARTEEALGPLKTVYTQKNETADHYIERLCDSLSREVALGRLEIRVATSDSVEQTIVLGRGATRMSARELLAEMDAVRRQAGRRPVRPGKTTVLDRLPEEIRTRLDEMRKGRQEG